MAIPSRNMLSIKEYTLSANPIDLYMCSISWKHSIDVKCEAALPDLITFLRILGMAFDEDSKNQPHTLK